MHSKKKLWITLICVSLCIILLLSLFIFYLSVVNPTIKMQGIVINANGTVQEELSLSVSSKMVRSSQKGEKELELTFKLPEEFPYRLDQLTSISTEPADSLPYYVLMGYCYDAAANKSAFAQCAYDKDASLLIIDWNDGSGRILVASADPNMSAQMIKEHFQDFL